MKLSFAFAGFRHSHALTLFERVKNTPGATVAAACEPDPEARRAAERQGVVFTHDDYETMFRTADSDAVVVGDCYGKRGEIVLAALKHGRHVLADKPFCTSQEELAAITGQCRKSGLTLGCMFDLATTPGMRTAQRLVRSGAIGTVQAIQFNGMHPLDYGTRPQWYFEPGMHGGTINDLAIHAFDYLPQLTGQSIGRIVSATAGNVAFPEHPAFQNTAQTIFELTGGATVSGDVSYTAPAQAAFALPSFWRFTVTGTEGWMEFSYADPFVRLAHGGKKQAETIAPDPEVQDYFDGFAAAVSGQPTDFPAKRILEAAGWALTAQQTANDTVKKEGFSL